jgi:aspartyl-tRNA(Asn)/glutamyl-tRNA(Gln) amidotransferase subunit B
MEEGSLRCDANVSIRPVGTTEYGTKTEIKNMNSFRSVHRAIESEIARQIEILESGGRIVQETRGWNEVEGTTHSMRSKEQAHDYRYFPDPDLVPMEIDRASVDRIKATLPVLPIERFERYHREYGLDPKQATQLVDNGPLAEYFDACVAASKNPQQTTNFVLGDLSRLANETGKPVNESPVTPAHLAELIALVDGKTINSKIAKELLARMWNGEGSPRALVEKEGLAQTSDTGEIEKFIADVLAANEKAVADYKSGKTNILGFLTGQVMKASRGKANPALVQELLTQKLS